MLGSIASTGAGMRRGLGQAAGMDARTDGERAKEELGKLDPSNPADQEKIIALVSPIDPEKAMEMQAKFSKDNAEIEAKDKLGGAMLKMARDQGNTQIEEWLLAGGDVKTAASTLLKKTAPQAVATMYLDGKSVRTSIIDGVLHYASESGWTEVKDKDKLTAQVPQGAKEKVTKTATLTKADRELYKSFFEEDESLQSAYQEEGALWGTNDNDNKRLQVETRAKAIYTNNPELGQLGALRKAVAEAGGVMPKAKTAEAEQATDNFADA
tara:strand:- start:244 stop:1047 length:804 start_codon:yes stop_codon:yes gene_type:complete